MRLVRAIRGVGRSTFLPATRPQAIVTLAVLSVMHGSAVAESYVTLGLVADGSATSSLAPAPALPPLNLGSFNININANASLSSNAPALAAFNRAAAQWEAFIADPITVDIDAGLAVLSPGIIGSTGNTFVQAGYTTIRNAMATDGADEADDGITASLPTAGQFSAFVASGSTISSNVVLTQANARALGFAVPGGSDASITFNSNFAFDFDNSNGVGAGLVDFETVASHEIGHALGFISTVDFVDGGATSINLLPLDFYRFADSASATTANFATATRSLTTGGTPLFDDGVNEWRMSTGVAQGDGRQASHWKDDALLGSHIGIMDPTLSNAVVFPLTAADLRAMDLIGYDLVVPEPATLSLLALAGLALKRRRR